MKKINSLLMLFFVLVGTVSVKAEILADVIKAKDLKAGDQITLMMTPAEGNYRHTRYMCAGDNSSKMFTQESADNLGNIWTLVASEHADQFYLCHLATGKFAGVAQKGNNDWMPLEAESVNKMGLYSFLDKNDKMNVVIKNPGTGLDNADKLCLTYQQDSHKIVRWGEWGAHGQWTVKRVRKADFYPTNIPEGMGYVRTDRHLDKVSLKSAEGLQEYSLPSPLKVYNKAMHQVFKAKSGESVKAAVGYTGKWMNAYIYVDFDKDGAFDETNDLKSFTTGNNLDAAEFVIPAGTAVGHYAMRYKVDWDCKNPAGAVKTTNGLMKNGGAICDVILNVHGDNCQVSVKSPEGCNVTAEGGGALTTVPFGQALKVKVVAGAEKVVTALVVRHGYNLDGEATVKGVAQYKEDRVNVTATGADWTATIPAEYMDGDVQIAPVVRGLNDKVNVTVAENADCAVTAENGEALAPTIIGKDLKVKVVAKNNKFVNAILVRHGMNVDGEQVVNGVAQYKEERINILSANSEHVVTIPAAYVDADVRIVPVVSDQVLIFADEFNGENMSQPNAVWRRSPRWGSTWNRLTSKAEDVVYLKDGNLVCRAIKNEPAFDPENEKIPNGDVNMRTGAIETSGATGFNFRYGKVECRAKANPFEGTFPAIWMMPSDGTGGWPSCGEIDIFELVNTENVAHHTIHTNWSYNLNHRASHNEYVDYAEYHVYGLEWDDTSLTFSVDGKNVWTYNKSTNIEELRQYQWPYDRNFYLILNQSVGRTGDWAHRPDENHVYEFLVDWIRVYQNPHHAKECELRAAINKVKEYGEGNGVNQYTIDHAALNAAQKVLEAAASKSVDELQTAINSIKNVATLNMPKANRFYRLRCADAKSKMKYVQSTQTNGKQDMKAKEEGKGVNGTFLYNGEGFISYVEGLFCGAGALKNVGEKTVAAVGTPSNGRMGQYTIKVDDKFLNGKDATLGVSGRTNDYTNCTGNWWFEEVDRLQITFKGNENGGFYATIYAPAALNVPAGVTAYTGKKGADYVALTAVEGVIPANTAVLLKLNDINDANKTKDFMIDYSNGAAPSANNDFVGSFETEMAGGNFYGLGYGSLENHKNTVGFYVLNAGQNMKGFRARLQRGVSQTNGLRFLFDGETTGIEEIDALVAGKAEIYDMSGRRVANPTKGLYIINGQKVYFK